MVSKIGPGAEAVHHPPTVHGSQCPKGESVLASRITSILVPRMESFAKASLCCHSAHDTTNYLSVRTTAHTRKSEKMPLTRANGDAAATRTNSRWVILHLFDVRRPRIEAFENSTVLPDENQTNDAFFDLDLTVHCIPKA